MAYQTDIAVQETLIIRARATAGDTKQGDPSPVINRTRQIRYREGNLPLQAHGEFVRKQDIDDGAKEVRLPTSTSNPYAIIDYIVIMVDKPVEVTLNQSGTLATFIIERLAVLDLAGNSGRSRNVKITALHDETEVRVYWASKEV